MSENYSNIILIGVLAVGGYFLYDKLIKPVTDVVGGTEKAVDLITTPGINFIPGLENVNVPELITTPGYQIIGDALSGIKLPKIPSSKDIEKKISSAGIDTRPGYQIIGDLLSPGGYVNKNTGLNTPAVVASNKAYAMIHPAPPIVTATATTSAMLTSGSNAVQSTQYMTGPKIVSGRKVM